MFVDEKAPGEQQTKADPISLVGLIAWLEQQPADTRYDFGDPHACVLASYLGRWCTGKDEVDIFGTCQDGVISNEPWTFGAVLERARAKSQ